ncbi:helix-turn-helix transcriptional regulator [Nostoc sp. FACHB-892]
MKIQLEHPPLLSELAQQVGVSVRTLQTGFSALFNTTVMGYLTQQRLENAQLLVQSLTPSNPPAVSGSIVTITGVENKSHG